MLVVIKNNKIWLVSSFLFYVSATLFIALQNKKDDIGFGLAFLFLLTLIALLFSAINYHPNKKDIINKCKRLFLIDWLLKLIVLISFWYAMLSLYDLIYYCVFIPITIIDLIIVIKILYKIK